MVITSEYAKKLVKEGKATLTTKVVDDDGRILQAIDRHDLQRVDHFRVK